MYTTMLACHTNIVYMSQILPHFFVSNPMKRQVYLIQARQGWAFKAGPKSLLFYLIVKARYCDCKKLL